MKGINPKEYAAIESSLRDAVEQVEGLRVVAEDYKESRSEKWAESDAGEAYEDKIEQIEEIICQFNDAIDELTAIVEED